MDDHFRYTAVSKSRHYAVRTAPQSDYSRSIHRSSSEFYCHCVRLPQKGVLSTTVVWSGARRCSTHQQYIIEMKEGIQEGMALRHRARSSSLLKKTISFLNIWGRCLLSSKTTLPIRGLMHRGTQFRFICAFIFKRFAWMNFYCSSGVNHTRCPRLNQKAFSPCIFMTLLARTMQLKARLACMQNTGRTQGGLSPSRSSGPRRECLL